MLEHEIKNNQFGRISIYKDLVLKLLVSIDTQYQVREKSRLLAIILFKVCTIII